MKPELLWLVGNAISRTKCCSHTSSVAVFKLKKEKRLLGLNGNIKDDPGVVKILQILIIYYV